LVSHNNIHCPSCRNLLKVKNVSVARPVAIVDRFFPAILFGGVGERLKLVRAAIVPAAAIASRIRLKQQSFQRNSTGVVGLQSSFYDR
jgi:hypothetical protein